MNAGLQPPVVDAGSVERLRGSAAPRKALFLDRDGVINLDHGHVHAAGNTDWVDGIFDLVRAAAADGYLAVVVTNQAGIGKGYYSQAQFIAHTEWVHDQFRSRGAPLLATHYCPHHPQASQPEFRVACSCRKPAPGLLLQACGEWGIDPRRSVMVGDKPSDMQAAMAAGLGRSCLVADGRLPPWPF